METIDNHITHNFGDIVYSCFIPHNLQWEHRMPNHGIIFVRSGRFVIEDHGNVMEVEAGGYVFLRRDCSVKVTKMPIDNEPYSGINISLPRKSLKEYYSILSSSNKLPRDAKPLPEVATRLPKTAAVEGLFSSLLAFVDRGESPAEELLNLKLQEAIVCLLTTDLRFYPTLFDFNDTWKIDLLEFMERNFTEDMTLEEFASYTGRSLATFKRDFARISDSTPQRWIMEHRLDLAHKILDEKSLPAKEVAYRVGFKNRSHFSTAFKARFGYAPGAINNKQI